MVVYTKRTTYVERRVMKAANSLPRKTIVLETGFVKSGTIDPLSNSPEILFIANTTAKRKKPNAPAPELTA